MVYVKIVYALINTHEMYRVHFNPSAQSIEEAAVFRNTFEGCLDFVTEQFIEKTKATPFMHRFNLEIEGALPEREKKILERLVALYNRTPEAYEVMLQRQQKLLSTLSASI